MRKISLYILIFALAAGGAKAQDAATQQQIDKLTGQLQDIIDTEANQSKQLEAMEHEIAELRDKVNAPVVNNSASSEDLQKLATQVQEIDRKRQDDKELILAKIEELLAKISAAQPVPVHHATIVAPDSSDDSSPADPAPQKGYYYKVKPGNNLKAIIKAYRAKGVKVTQTEIVKANPGLKPDSLEAGKTIFIPDPNAP